MPPRLPITDKDRARRHVLGQTLYRLRKKFQFFYDLGLMGSADRVKAKMESTLQEYEDVGGKPDD